METYYNSAKFIVQRKVCFPETKNPVAKFIVPDWRDKVNSGIGLSYTGLPGYISWRAGTTTLCWIQLYPLKKVRNYEFGYWGDYFHQRRLYINPPISPCSTRIWNTTVVNTYKYFETYITTYPLRLISKEKIKPIN